MTSLQGSSHSPETHLFQAGQVAPEIEKEHPDADRERPRPLSCRECRRRKIRCDRNVPCRPCRERGEGDLCNRLPSARPNKTASKAVNPEVMIELESLRRRLARVEAALNLEPEESPNDTHEWSGLKEDGLAGAIEEAALGIGEVRRWQGAPRLVEAAAVLEDGGHSSQQWLNLSHAACVALLPVQNESEILVHAFCEHLNWMCGSLHEPTLIRLHQDFWAAGRLQDGMFLALLFSVLSNAAYLLDEEQISTAGLNIQRLRDSASVWFDCCLATFFRCDGLLRPSLMACQTMTSLNYAFHLSGNTRIHGAIGHINNGYGRALNLHLLGSDRSGSVEEIVHREVGRRAWWQLVEAEWYFMTYHRYSAIAPNHFNTTMPDLLDDGVYASSTSNTHKLMFLLATCHSARVLYDLYGALQPNQTPSYEAVLEASNRLERIRQRFCPPLDHQPSMSHTPPSRTQLHMMRVVEMTLAYRSYLVHRSYFVKSLHEEAYRQSHATCLTAAEVILGLVDKGIPETFYRLWNITMYLVAAGIVLALDLVASTKRRSVPDKLSRHGKLKTLVDLINTVADQSGIGARGAKLIEHLCTAEREISAGRATRIPVSRDELMGLLYSSHPDSDTRLSDGNSPLDFARPTILDSLDRATVYSGIGPAAADLAAVELDEDMIMPPGWADPDGRLGGLSFSTDGLSTNRDQFLGFFSDLLPE